MTCRIMLYRQLTRKLFCFSLFCQGCWYFRNRIASLRLSQALTVVYFPSSVLSLLSGQKRWPSCLWFWVIWMSRSITSHQISLVRLSYAFLNVSLHQMHIFNICIVSSCLPAASHWLVAFLCVCRLCHALVPSSSSDRSRRLEQDGVWGGGVCAVYR